MLERVVTMADDLHGPQAARSRLSILLMLTLCILGNGRCQVPGQQGHKRPPFCENADDRQKEPTSFLWSVVRTRNGETVVSEEEDEDKDTNPASYFFGTIHVPYTRVWDFIPDNTKRAFEHSDHVFFELDLTDPYTISALTSCQLLPQGRNLAQVLPDELFRRLKRHLDYVKLMMPSWLTADQRGRGLYADYLFNAIAGNWERKRPVWVMLMVNSLTETDVRSRGIPVLDLYLAQEAERLDKVTGAVERVEEQCVPLNGLNLSQVLFALNQTLHQQECIRAGDGRAPYTTDDLINHYNCGDLNAVIFNRDTTQVPTLVNATLPPFDLFTARKIDEYFREELIYRRNVRMGKRVIELLAANPGKSFFFAFGAGHFLGNNTVLDVVRDAGFSVEHVSVYNTIGPRKRKGRPKAPVVPELSPLRDFSVLSSNTVVEEDGLDGVVPSWAFEESNGVLATNSDVGPTPRNRNRNRNRKQGSSHSMRGHVAVASIAQPQSQSPFTPKARNFNDLWVRLDSFTTTRPPSRKVPSAKGDKATETHAMQRNLRIRYGPSKGASLDPVCNWWLLILASITLTLCVGERSCW